MGASGTTNRLSVFGLATLLLVLLVTSGCATIIKGTTQSIPVSSDPSGADILVDGMLVGSTPADIEFKRKRDHLVVIEKKNYGPKSIAVVKNVGGAVWGNIIAGGLIGWGVDAASGAQNNLSPATIFVRLEKLGEGVQAVSSDSDSSAGIRKLNDLDQMRDNKQISDEEYTRARIAIIQKYFPEMIPKPEDLDAADTPTPDPDP
tara:strand:+ start:1024 stop:1635 length:612 start_codon:yes stop_codon:yes gene_type:complete